MKKLLKKYRVVSNRNNVPITGRHIHSLRIRAFASEGTNFTEVEDAHFDMCRDCRLKVVDALRKHAAPMVVHITIAKAAA
jgi:hypothetical protein